MYEREYIDPFAPGGIVRVQSETPGPEHFDPSRYVNAENRTRLPLTDSQFMQLTGGMIAREYIELDEVV